MKISSLSTFLGASALLLLAGCHDFDDTRSQEWATPSSVIELAPVPPPAQSEETHDPLTDLRGQVWRAGHWEYENQHFEWYPGEILTRPSPTAVWSPDRWEHRLYGWAFIPGHWE